MSDTPSKFQELREKAFVALQAILPTHFLSWLIFKIARIRNEGFKDFLITNFIKLYKINLDDAEFERTASYPDFNSFFTRALKADARPLAPQAAALMSPVDGRISQMGAVKNGSMIQAKGVDYTVSELLGGARSAALFRNGSFCTIYLAPHNYHRIHMPTTGRLREWGYQPGRLFSVNDASARRIPKLFARNERVFALFDTDYGPMAMVLVGALFVGSIETTWNGLVTPPHGQKAGSYNPVGQVVIMRGREMGRFNMGSTVILLAAPRMVLWHPKLKAGSPVQMGQGIGALHKIV